MTHPTKPGYREALLADLAAVDRSDASTLFGLALRLVEYMQYDQANFESLLWIVREQNQKMGEIFGLADQIEKTLEGLAFFPNKILDASDEESAIALTEVLNELLDARFGLGKIKKVIEQ